MNAIAAQFFVKMDDDFCVGVAGKAVTAALKFEAELGKVINLAVEYNPDRAIFVKDRLVAPCDVDNAQAANAKTDAGLNENAFVIGTAMHNRLAHAVNCSGLNRLVSRVYNARNSTHALPSALPGDLLLSLLIVLENLPGKRIGKTHSSELPILKA
jgi:hypothetical protein